MNPPSQRGLPSARRAVAVWQADAALAAVTLIWGFTFPVVKAALRYASPLYFNALRLSLAALLLAIVYRAHLQNIRWATWRASAWLGLCLATGYAFQTAGLVGTTPSKSAFLTGLSVVLVPLLVATLWRRRIPALAWVSTGVALAGLYLLVAPLQSNSGGNRGAWLTLACAFAFAAHIASLGELAPRHPVRQLAVLQILFAGVFTWLLLPTVEVPRWQPHPALWAALGVTVVLATAVAFTVQTWAQQFTPATHTAVVFALEPVFGWLASALFWHDHLSPHQLLGALLILTAILGVEWKPRFRSAVAGT